MGYDVIHQGPVAQFAAFISSNKKAQECASVCCPHYLDIPGSCMFFLRKVRGIPEALQNVLLILKTGAAIFLL